MPISLNNNINFVSVHTIIEASFLLVNGVKIYQVKAKDSGINSYLLCLGNISKSFTVHNVKTLNHTDMCIIFKLIMIVFMFMTF